MKTCPKCGFKTPNDNAKFCKQCGSQFEAAAAPTGQTPAGGASQSVNVNPAGGIMLGADMKASQTVATNPTNTAYTNPTPQSESNYDYTNQESKKSSNAPLWILLGIIAAIGIGVAIYFLLIDKKHSSSSGEREQTTEIHLNNTSDDNDDDDDEIEILDGDDTIIDDNLYDNSDLVDEPASETSYPSIPSSANFRVSGNIDGYGYYSLVVSGSNGQISPGVSGKEGMLDNVSYNTSTGHLYMDAYTMNGTYCGYYSGTISSNNGVIYYHGSFTNTSGKERSFIMKGN